MAMTMEEENCHQVLFPSWEGQGERADLDVLVVRVYRGEAEGLELCNAN